MPREYLESVVVAVILALFIRTFVVQAFKIPTGSMETNLIIGDHLGKVDRLLADGARHDVADGALGNEPQAHQHAPHGNVVVALLGERDGELIGRDQPLLHQQLAQAEFFP